MIEGADLSHWQSKLDEADAAKFVAAGGRFAYVKFSQGVSYRDDCGVNNTAVLRAAGVKVGPYHWVSPENALSQYNWYVKCMGDVVFDLPPALDVEQAGVTQAIVDSMGMKLTTWMQDRPELASFKYPAIYTNYSTGNRVFTAQVMSRYLLWIANWGVSSPNIPKIWQGKPYYVWQDRVMRGAQEWGIDGDLDHDIWGKLLPFPGDEPPPPPPPPVELAHVVVTIGGVNYEGDIPRA